MHFLRNLRRCTFTRTNRPNRLVGNRTEHKILCSYFEHHRFELARHHSDRFTGFTLLERLTHTNDGLKPRSQGSLGLQCHSFVRVTI